MSENTTETVLRMSRCMGVQASLPELLTVSVVVLAEMSPSDPSLIPPHRAATGPTGGRGTADWRRGQA
jgi:hypothetical protein